MSVKIVRAEDFGKLTVYPLVSNDLVALREELEEAEDPRKKEIEQLLISKKDEKGEGKQEPTPVSLSDFWRDVGALIMLVRRPG